MQYRYTQWDGSQEIAPLDPDELLSMLSEDLLQDGNLQRALERMLLRGGADDNQRVQGLRDLLDRLRRRREEELSRHNLGSVVDGIQERLEEIVRKEREGIEQRLSEAGESGAPEEMQDLLKQLSQRKLQALDNLPEDAGGMLQQLMDYEFMSAEARDDFNDLVDKLRQQMMQSYFEGMQQGLQGLTPQDLAPVRDMVRELNQMLSRYADGSIEPEDFEQFMQKHGGLFPDGIGNIEDLIQHMQRQASQMASLLQSLSEEQRQQLQETMNALLRDDRLAWDLMQMAGLLEQITGQPLGKPTYFDGDMPMSLDEALQLMGRMGEFDELERQFRDAIRTLDAGKIDAELAGDLLGQEIRAMLEELSRMTGVLQEAGLIRDGRNGVELTAKAVRRIGEKALRTIFSELRHDRSGDHQSRDTGAGADQQNETRPWEFGDQLRVDIGKSIANAVFRQGPGTPVPIEVKDFEIYKTESYITASTVIVLDMSMSMLRSGAFVEAKRVALALDTLMSSRYPRDYLELVVFSYFAMEIKAGRLLDSELAINPRGTNIQEALNKARKLLRKRKSSNRQIILITDGQPTMYTASDGQLVRTWTPDMWPRYSPEAMEETLKEVRRCTRDGIKINLFMMASDPALVAFGKYMTQINKGRAFMTTPGKLGHYVLFDYLNGKTKVL